MEYIEKKVINCAIVAVGTKIFLQDEYGAWSEDEEYSQNVKIHTQFDREAIYEALTRYEGINDTLTRMYPQSNIRFQPGYSQKERVLNTHSECLEQEYKISYHFEGDTQLREQIEKSLKEFLSSHGFPQVHVVTSIDREIASNVTQYNVDILAVTKDYPVNYITSKLKDHLKSNSELIAITFGDSGNDIDLITNSGTYGVYMSDSADELEEELKKRIRKEDGQYKVIETNAHKQLVYKSPYPCPAAILNVLESRSEITANVLSKQNY
jgi:hydroxymethylpyrimidine pyrophosphatase-like HAD family hydrolase